MRRGELARAAVDQHEIGRGPAFDLALALGELAEAPLQHLAHHGVVVARGKVLALDIELPILAFDEAFGAGDDHGADRVGAGDMAVVVDLDARGRLGQIRTLGKARENGALRGGVGQPSSERLAGIVEACSTRSRRLPPRLRLADIDLAPGLGDSASASSRRFGDIVRQQDSLGTGLSS